MKLNIEREKQSIFFNYLALVSGYFGEVVLGILIISVLTRIMGPGNYGSYRLFFIIVNLILIVTAWTSPSVVRFAKEEMIKSNKMNISYTSQTIIAVSTLLLAISLLIIFKGILFNSLGLGNNNIILIMFFLAVILFTSTRIYPNFLIVIEKIKIYAMLTFLKRLLFLGIIALLVAFKKLDILSAIFSTVIVELGVLLPSFFLMGKSSTFSFSFSQEKTTDIMKYSFPLLMSISIVYIMESIDMIYIKMFLGLESLGIYAVASSLFLYLIVLPQLLNKIITPLIVSYRFEENKKQVHNYIEHVIPILTMILLFCVGLIIPFAEYAILLIVGEKYSGSIVPFNILCIGAVYQGVRIFHLPIIAGYDLTKQNLVIGTFAAICNIVLNYFLIKEMGMIGAAVATSLSYTVVSIITSLYIRKKFGIMNLYSALLPLFISMFIGIYIFDFPLLIRFPAYLLGFLTLVFVTKRLNLFNENDLEIIDKISMPIWLKKICYSSISYLS